MYFLLSCNLVLLLDVFHSDSFHSLLNFMPSKRSREYWEYYQKAVGSTGTFPNTLPLNENIPGNKNPLRHSLTVRFP